MDKKSKKANELFMKRVNHKLIKKGWDDTTKRATRKKNESDKASRNVYDRGDSKQSERAKDVNLSIDNLIEDIQMRAAVKMGLKKIREIEKPKAAPKNHSFTPQRNNEKTEDNHFHKFSDSKERKKIWNRYTFKLKGETGNPSAIIVNKDDKRPNESQNFRDGERKKVVEKYSFRIKGEGNHYVSDGPIVVSGEDNKPVNDITQCGFKTADQYFAKKQINLEAPSKKFESINLEIKTNKRDENKVTVTTIKKDDKDVRRKPIIKTIASKNDSKVYKEVSFANKKKRTQLQITMPGENKTGSKSTRESSAARLSASKHRENISESKIKSSKTSVKEKVKRKKKEVYPEFANIDVMQTEAAMWAPSSVNSHTQPYYDAWVDKTLTAISRLSEDDETIKNHLNITQLYRAGNRQKSPDPIYVNYADERYTGRIKVRQR